MKRKIDENGRIAIPVEMRKELAINDEVECNLRGNKIIITNPENRKHDILAYLEDQKQKYGEYQEITKEMVIEDFNKIIEFIEVNK